MSTPGMSASGSSACAGLFAIITSAAVFVLYVVTSAIFYTTDEHNYALWQILVGSGWVAAETTAGIVAGGMVYWRANEHGKMSRAPRIAVGAFAGLTFTSLIAFGGFTGLGGLVYAIAAAALILVVVPCNFRWIKLRPRRRQ